MFENTMVLLFFIIIFFASILSIRQWVIYKKIRKTGNHGIGRMISCKRNLFTDGGIAIIPRYSPVIEFYYNEKRYEMQAMGSFGVRHGKAGDEIAIIFSEEYPDKVVIKNRHVLDSKLVEIVLYLVLGAALLAYYACF